MEHCPDRRCSSWMGPLCGRCPVRGKIHILSEPSVTFPTCHRDKRDTDLSSQIGRPGVIRRFSLTSLPATTHGRFQGVAPRSLMWRFLQALLGRNRRWQISILFSTVAWVSPLLGRVRTRLNRLWLLSTEIILWAAAVPWISWCRGVPNDPTRLNLGSCNGPLPASINASFSNAPQRPEDFVAWSSILEFHFLSCRMVVSKRKWRVPILTGPLCFSTLRELPPLAGRESMTPMSQFSSQNELFVGHAVKQNRENLGETVSEC